MMVDCHTDRKEPSRALQVFTELGESTVKA